jgi:hypothetical protein
MVQKKIRLDLIRGRSSVSRAVVRAYTFVRVFSHEYVFKVFFFELRGGLVYLKVDKCIITHSGTRVQPVHVQYTYTYSKLHVQ